MSEWVPVCCRLGLRRVTEQPAQADAMHGRSSVLCGQALEAAGPVHGWSVSSRKAGGSAGIFAFHRFIRQKCIAIISYIDLMHLYLQSVSLIKQQKSKFDGYNCLNIVI